jgi:hypothetical protein
MGKRAIVSASLPGKEAGQSTIVDLLTLKTKREEVGKHTSQHLNWQN